MPKAFSLTYGLDLDTEAASFWAWLRDVRDAMAGNSHAGQQVRDLVESQRADIDRFIAEAEDKAAAKQELTVALALVGFQYASQQKLLNGLQELGLLTSPDQPRLPAFDTISERVLDGPEPPR